MKARKRELGRRHIFSTTLPGPESKFRQDLPMLIDGWID